MCRTMFGMYSYDLFNGLAFYAFMIAAPLFYYYKKNVAGRYSQAAISFVSDKNALLGKIVKVVLLSLEALILAYSMEYGHAYNRIFGEWTGIGVANYFGCMIAIPIYWFIICAVLMINPLKQINISTPLMPITLFFFKHACFFNGCCWGIPWEHGFYNTHDDHPGYQVPVQLIEAYLAFIIFFILLWYLKRAKPGTIYPMFVMLYSGTRFFSEFLRTEESVFLIFKAYQLLCMAGFVIGLILFLIMRKYGDRLSDLCDKVPDIIKDRVFAERNQRIAEERAQWEIEEAERIEKVKAARAKAKARSKAKHHK